jgi:hypothetical protein
MSKEWLTHATPGLGLGTYSSVAAMLKTASNNVHAVVSDGSCRSVLRAILLAASCSVDRKKCQQMVCAGTLGCEATLVR